MQVYGNIELLKDSIRDKYREDIEILQKEAEEKIRNIKQNAIGDLKRLRDKAELSNEAESKKLK